MKYGSFEAPNHSMLARRNRCLREHYYSDYLGLEPRGVANVRLVVGTAWHAAMEALHSGKGLDAAFEAMLTHLHDLSFPLEGEFEWLDAGHLEWLVREYATHYKMLEGEDPQFMRVPISIKSIEGLVQFEGETEGADMLAASEMRMIIRTGMGPLSITPDLIVYNKLLDEYALVDHKLTFSNLGQPLEWRALRGHQLKLYMTVMREATGLPITRIICNAVHAGPQLTKSGNARSVQRFMRYSREVFESEVDETKDWCISTTDRIGQDRNDALYEMGEVAFAQNVGTHCMWCDMKQLCMAPPTRRAGVMEMEYSKKEKEDE